MKTIVMTAMMLLAVTGIGITATNQPPQLGAVAKMTLKQKLSQIVLPEIHVDAAAPQKVIEWLGEESKKHSLDKTPVNFVWQVPADAKLRPVTLNLVKVPLVDVLGYVTEAAGLRYRVDAHAVVVYVPESAKPAPKNVQPE